jgi:hypothetical protein
MFFHLKLLISGQLSVVLSIYFTTHTFNLENDITAIEKKTPASHFLPAEWKVNIQGIMFTIVSPKIAIVLQVTLSSLKATYRFGVTYSTILYLEDGTVCSTKHW